MRVLVIEDNQDDYLLLSRSVKKITDIQLEWRDTLETGLAYIESSSIDALLLDMSLPDGYGLAIFDKAQVRFPALPIIILTGGVSSELALEAVRHGAQDYLVKGQVSPEMLVRSLHYAIEHKRVEENLRQSEQRFSLLVNSVQDYGIFTLDINGSVAIWNAGAERIEGHSAEEIIGQNFACFFISEAIEKGEPAHILEATARDNHFNTEGWQVRKDGTRFWADTVFTALRNDDNRLIGFSEVTRDLTERRLTEEALRRSEQLYRTVACNFPNGSLILYDRDMRYTLVDGLGLNEMGLSEERMEGKIVWEVFPREVVEEALPRLRAPLEGKKLTQEVPFAGLTF